MEMYASIGEMLDLKGFDRMIAIIDYNDEKSLSCTINFAFYYAREYYTIIRELPTGKEQLSTVICLKI